MDDHGKKEHGRRNEVISQELELWGEPDRVV
jgi:hypothetical protein